MRGGAALGIVGTALAVATPALAANNSTRQTLTGSIPPSVTLSQLSPGTNLSTLTPGSTSHGTEPTMAIDANTAFNLTVTAGTWSTAHLANPLQLVTTATPGTGDTDSAPTGSTVTVAWGTSTATTIGTGSAEADSATPALVAPAQFSGAISQPVSYADQPTTYHVTLTYTVAATV